MEIYTTEEEQVEALKKWWRENGKAVIAGFIIGFGAIFGWREWQAHVTEEAQKASRQFQEMAIQGKVLFVHKSPCHRVSSLTTSGDLSTKRTFPRIRHYKVHIEHRPLAAKRGEGAL